MGHDPSYVIGLLQHAETGGARCTRVERVDSLLRLLRRFTLKYDVPSDVINGYASIAQTHSPCLLCCNC